jgi:DNA-binding GntR family transcriptional regulator
VTRSGAREAKLPLLKPRVLRQEVLDALRHAILTKEMAPGSRLLEAEVAAQMGVSRAPVREAVRQLEQEGLVELVPHRGAVVLGLPDAEIDTIYEMRATIEARAMAAVSQTITPEQDARIHELIEQMREPLTRNDINALSELDWQLHGLILELSQLTLLRRIWTSLYSLVQLRSYQALGQPGPAADYFRRTAIESHSVLLEALRTGDAERASQAGRNHVLEVPRILAGETPR